MLTTSELRWFYPGNIPQAITQWFNQSPGTSAPPEAREDIYLYAPESEFLGMKLRQGRLEIKWRAAELGIMRCNENVEGKAEKWGKWLCEDPTKQMFQPQLVAGKTYWVNVQKLRLQRKYQILPNKSVIVIPINQSTENSCNVELTQITINKKPWWSIALEASNSQAHATTNLQIVANAIFNPAPQITLQTHNSYAYPKWLSLVTPHAA